MILLQNVMSDTQKINISHTIIKTMHSSLRSESQFVVIAIKYTKYW